jgi:hypothetical protein
MNIKKKTIVSLSLALVIVAAGVSYYRQYNSFTGNIISLDASDIKDFESYQSIEQFSDAVIVGTAKIDASKDRNVVKHFPDGQFEYAYSKTDFVVNKVIKGNLAVNSTVEVIEPYGYYQTAYGKQQVTLDGYKGVKNNSKYYLFLKKNLDGQYTILNYTLGKHNIDNTDVDDNNAQPYDNATLNKNKQNIRSEVLKKTKELNLEK